MAVGDIGYGVALTFDTFTGYITSLSGPSEKKDAPEITNSQSPANTAPAGTAASVGWKEFIDGMIDAGEASVDLIFDPDTPSPVRLAKNTLTITFPIPAGKVSGATFVCSAVCTGFERTAPVDDKMTARASWKLSGIPTQTASA